MAVPAPALLFTKFTTVPLVKVPVTLASLASGQPSPSESKSKRFGIPSPSVSISAARISQPLELRGTKREYPAQISIAELVYVICVKVP